MIPNQSARVASGKNPKKNKDEQIENQNDAHHGERVLEH